jgi:ribosomal protein S12 methylthiotransferase
MREQAKICNYLDMPLQHVSDAVLKTMRRGINEKRTRELIARIRQEVPGLALRTTLLVGHPGETETDHKALLKFVEEMKFDRLGVFTYSHEENTHAGDKYEDLIDEETKERRMEEIMELQQEISLQINRTHIGKTYKTLIDKEESGYYIGRTEFDSPEVDNEVIVQSDNQLKIGAFYEVEIIDALEYDLIGKPVS